MNATVLLILVAGLLPILCAGLAKWGASGYDNQQPRAWLAKQDGFRARADAAQQNSFEAFPFFALAVVLADVYEAAPEDIEFWGWAFIVLRLIYIFCYVTDRAAWRSVVWILGLAVVIRLYALVL